MKIPRGFVWLPVFLVILGVLVISGGAYWYEHPGALPAASQEAAALTEAQIQSVLGLLVAFSIPQATISNVNNILHNNSTSSPSTSVTAPVTGTSAPSPVATTPTTPTVTSQTQTTLQNCTLDSTTVQSGSSKTFYMVPSVATGDTCSSIGITRTCTNGTLSGSSDYSHATCAPDTSLAQIRPNLKAFVPYVWSTAWYPWFNDSVGTDQAGRGFTLLKQQIATIKAQGFNSLWIGGNFPWSYLQSTPGTWNMAALGTLKAYLDVLKQNNMRAIFQLNYIGPGFSPPGIDGCLWMKDPAQVQKFTDFATAIGAQLSAYNSMIYYMVYTEIGPACAAQEGYGYYTPGYHYKSDGSYDVVPTTAPYSTYQQTDVHGMNQMLKASIGRFSKNIPKAVRDQMYIGIHDSQFVTSGIITDDAPIENPIDFDYISFAYYPTWTELSTYPSDSSLAGVDTTSSVWKNAYSQVLTDLDTAKGRITRFYPSTPIMLGEFGWDAWNPAANQPTLLQDSPARNVAFQAMLDWSITRKVGFSVWAWVPLQLDGLKQDGAYDNGLSLTVRDSKIETATQTLTTVLQYVRNRLLGTPLPVTQITTPSIPTTPTTVTAPAECTFNGKSVTSGSSVTAWQSSSVAYGQTCQSQQRTCTNGTLSGSYTSATCSVAAPVSCAFNGSTIAHGASVTAYQVSATNSSTCNSQQRTCNNGTLSGSYSDSSCAAAPSGLPPAPASLSASCNASGTQGTFSWPASAGATSYYLNVYDNTTGQYVTGPNALSTSPATATTIPGHTIWSWVYSANATGWSSSSTGASPLACPQ